MAGLTILDRFRPVGAPGPAGPVGVPASDQIGPAAELVPVFAALAADVDACARIVEEARNRAQETLSSARQRAGAITAQAQLDVSPVQASAAARVEQSAAEKDAELLAQAEQDADTLEKAGRSLLPSTVQKVIDRILSDYLALS
jgi:vacuolar-type H+-ATPase subunit H